MMEFLSLQILCGLLQERSSNMKKYIVLIVFILQPFYIMAQNTKIIAQNDTNRKQDSIYFYNVFVDPGIEQQLFVSVNVKSVNYTGTIIMGAINFRFMVHNLLNFSSMDSTFSFVHQLLLNDDTLRVDSQEIAFDSKPRFKLMNIPIVDEYASKGQEAFLSYFFMPYAKSKDWSFIKDRELLISKSSDLDWINLQHAIIHHLINWRFYCRKLHSADGRLLCYKEYVPSLYPRKPK